MLYVPELPNQHCKEAAITQLFLYNTALDIEKMLGNGIDASTGEPITEQQIIGRQMRLNIASKYLSSAVSECMSCQVYKDSDTNGCPNDIKTDDQQQPLFGFIRTILL
ncbi:hypothetical protein EB118_01840 [bacterium]|nr:hypothetical protein [bacterium]NBX97927.1 hypothetical protein [bacterium]NDC94319.1 hypothetical protein [bacterium]NDD82781.1 hypothetical protein [bacterium]NDG28829.1 hypothetical protein [bacterium]